MSLNRTLAFQLFFDQTNKHLKLFKLQQKFPLQLGPNELPQDNETQIPHSWKLKRMDRD